MTLAEYKANPEDWSPTFTVETEDDFSAWQSNAAENDYERVLVAASLTITLGGGVNLSDTGTKQVVFAEGVHLSLTLSANNYCCFCYDSLPADDDYWSSNLSVGAVSTDKTVGIFKYLKNMDNPVVMGCVGTGHTYGFWYCNNIYSPAVKDNTFGNTYVFHYCGNVFDASFEGANVGNRTSSTGYGFYECNNVHNAVLKGSFNFMNVYFFIVVNGLYNSRIEGTVDIISGGSYGGACVMYHVCTNVYNPIISGTITGGISGTTLGSVSGFASCYWVHDAVISGTLKTAVHASSKGYVYCFSDCIGLYSPVIDGYILGTNAGDVYGFYRCSKVVTPKAILLDFTTGNTYMHIYWEGLIENQPGSAASVMYSPDYGTAGLAATPVIYAGKTVNISWSFIAPDGSPVSGKTAYLYVSKNQPNLTGGYSLIYSGTASSFSYVIPSDATITRFRLQYAASTDGTGYHGKTYLFGDDISITPVISGEDADLGLFSDVFTPYEFSVSKHAEDTSGWTAAEVQVYVDNKEKQRFNAETGAAKTVYLGREVWTKLLNGVHTIKLYAKRIIAGKTEAPLAIRTLIFEKQKNTAALSLSSPAVSETMPEQMPEQIELTVGGVFPEGSNLTVETCNNGYDPAPAWEDMTADYEAGQPHQFTNAEKTAVKWGVNIRLTLERGTAAGDCYIDSVVGDYS
jgi:hypothetical protein